MAPEAVNVEFPYPDQAGSTHGGAMTTWLFRDGSLPETLFLADQFMPKSARKHIVSAGCGVAEPDAILALLGDPATLKCYDANQLVVDKAGAGQHLVRKVQADHRGRDEQTRATEKALRKLGFDTFYGPYDGAASYQGGTWLKADARRLREPHDVEISRHDLREPLPLDEPADVIFAHNVLCHVGSMKEALQGVAHFNNVLAKLGILSVGGETLLPRHHGQRDEKEFIGLLAKKFDLWPLVVNEFGKPTSFARPELHAQIGLNGQPIRILRGLFEDD